MGLSLVDDYLTEAPYAAFVRHLELDDQFYSANYRFVSDWNGWHPFIPKYQKWIEARISGAPGVERYQFYDRNPELADRISSFHRSRGESVAPNAIAAGDGSSSLLSAIWFWARATGIEEVRYVPPLYFTAHHLLNVLGLRPRPVSGQHAFEEGFQINLPATRALLYVADPVWYAGRKVPRRIIDRIADWQAATGSLVLVDGSFQYIDWSGNEREASAGLLPEQTLRIVCPTKALGLHGYRFAYCILPPELRRPILDVYESLHGSTNTAGVAFGNSAMEIMTSPSSNTEMRDHLGATYGRLVEDNVFESRIEPECGYFMFGKPRWLAPDALVMTGDHFENTRFPGHIRVNLLNGVGLSAIIEGKRGSS